MSILLLLCEALKIRRRIQWLQNRCRDNGCNQLPGERIKAEECSLISCQINGDVHREAADLLHDFTFFVTFAVGLLL